MSDRLTQEALERVFDLLDRDPDNQEARDLLRRHEEAPWTPEEAAQVAQAMEMLRPRLEELDRICAQADFEEWNGIIPDWLNEPVDEVGQTKGNA